MQPVQDTAYNKIPHGYVKSNRTAMIAWYDMAYASAPSGKVSKQYFPFHPRNIVFNLMWFCNVSLPNFPKWLNS